MSEPKIHGFTAWVNVRIELENEKKLNNVLIDLFQDFHWQHLIEKITGSPFPKIGSFSGISQIQKCSRIEWIIKELKSWNIVNEKTEFNAKLIAARNSEETFSLLSKLVHQDIQFIWQRLSFLQLNDCKEISQYEFKIIPEKKDPVKPPKFLVKENLFAGFGTSSKAYTEVIDENVHVAKRERIFANDVEILSYKTSISGSHKSIPKPMNCLLKIITNYLQTSTSKKSLKINKLSDMCDVGVLCAFFNSILPETFVGEILPNDRWSVNLILRTLEKILKIESDFEAADLNSNEDLAVMAYFTALFLSLYRFRQCLKVLEYKEDLEYTIRLEKFSQEMLVSEKDIKVSVPDYEDRIEIKQSIIELNKLQERFDIKKFGLWRKHCKKVLQNADEILKKKMQYQYEMVQIPRNMTVADLCVSQFIHTKNLTPCGYYQLKTNETVNDEREIILRDINNDKIITDSDRKSKSTVRRLLKVRQSGPVDLDAKTITKYEVYLDSNSKNKTLGTDDKFLYQLFPNLKFHWKNLLLKSACFGNITTLKILTRIFSDDKTFVNWHEPETGNTALHVTVQNNHFDSTLCLLINGAEIDAKNKCLCTPLFDSAKNQQEKLCWLLLEWGADISVKNTQNQTVLDVCKINSLKTSIEDKHKFYSQFSNSVISENSQVLTQTIYSHRINSEPIFINLVSRCIQGSTLLHTAAHFSNISAIKELLMLRVQVNQRDYKGQSALHRAKDLEIINLLLDAGADISHKDDEQNEPLHETCYGSENKESQIEKVKLLIKEGADLVAKNSQNLMPIHCAAMQGRSDIIELLLESDESMKISEILESEMAQPTPYSLNFLSLSGGYLDCTYWLLDHGFNFKDNETDKLLINIMTGKLVLHGTNLNKALTLLFSKTGADINKLYPPMFQSALHMAAYLPDSTELLSFLIGAGADIDALDIEQSSPLFIACRTNNLQSAWLLIDNNANINVKNKFGHTAFDIIPDYIEWIRSGIFDDETINQLKAYNLKSTRNTIIEIDKQIHNNADRSVNQQLQQLEIRLDQSLLEDDIERAKFRVRLRPKYITP